MANGYTGKILRVNLTDRSISTIETSKYEQWGGGHGMGSAIFWDLCPDKAIDGFDPRNVVTMMVSPLAGTLAPTTGRTEVQGIGVHAYPVAWFTRSNFGGAFGAQLKFAGWDGIVIEGKADRPVWLSIINDKVEINDASAEGDALWGLTTSKTQQAVIARMTQKHAYPSWLHTDDGYTTQRPSVVCIGPAGENLSRIATIVHGGGSSGGQGGFGGVFGSKNLKAIGVLGTGSVEVADPIGLINARAAFAKTLYDIDNPQEGFRGSLPGDGSDPPVSVVESNHVVGCTGCAMPCRRRYVSGVCNESQCGEVHWYITATTDDVIYESIDLIQEYGLNINDMSLDDNGQYIIKLYNMGILGPGKQIDSNPLPMEEIIAGTQVGAEAYIRAISYREGIGDDLAEGLMRAAVRWGRAEEDLKTGMLFMPGYGIMFHSWFPAVYWGYGSILSDRDLNEHDLSSVPTYLPPDEVVRRYTDIFAPYHDPFMMDYNWQKADGSNMAAAKATGIYSESKAKLVAWHRHFSRFWKQSALFCDSFTSQFFGGTPPDYRGFSPDMEVKFYNLVTGKNLSFTDGVELGRKIYNLDRAIWTLQGRTRDMEVFAPWIYRPGTGEGEVPPAGGNTTRKNALMWNGSAWTYEPAGDMFLDWDAFEEWKTKFYQLEGWDPSNGWPTRATLEALGLKHVADELQAKGKLGA